MYLDKKVINFDRSMMKQNSLKMSPNLKNVFEQISGICLL